MQILLTYVSFPTEYKSAIENRSSVKDLNVALNRTLEQINLKNVKKNHIFFEKYFFFGSKMIKYKNNG